MEPNIKFYKIKFIKDFIYECERVRTELLSELIDNATDPVIVMRRIRTLKHLAEYQAQILQKIEEFETDDPYDYQIIPLTQRWRPMYPPEINIITQRGA